MYHLKYFFLVAAFFPISIQQSFGEEALYTEVTYPFFEDTGPFPGVIILHTSGGWGTVDHVIPRSRGGLTSWDNVVAACSSCNLVKGNRLPRDCGMVPATSPVEPSTHQLQNNGRAVPPNYLHESWRDFLYWDSELEQG